MPTLASTLVPNALVLRDGATNPSISSQGANASSKALQVICAWPVSGAYGPGPRIIYYVLVAIFVFSRNYQGLRDAALATALLFPGVAACHGIVLAAVHVNGVVDMDVYGAFQVCTIAVMASPLTVRLSQTYFSYRGSKIIFFWTALVLAGLLSLTVEFYRSNSYDCRDDGFEIPTPSSAKLFPYGTNITCGLPCSVEQAPRSPMRGGSSDNIYVVPAPEKLTLGTATILSAACCVPAVLSLIALGSRIIEVRMTATFGLKRDGLNDQRIEGTNGATVAQMKAVNQLIRMFLVGVQIPVFVTAVIAIIVLGERNFFSAQVLRYTEPAASIGQWAPIITTVGSLYLILVVDVKGASEHHHHHYNGGEETLIVQDPPSMDNSPSSGSVRSINVDRPGCLKKTPRSSLAMQEVGRQDTPRATNIHTRPSNDLFSATGPTRLGPDLQDNISMVSHASSRHVVAKALLAVGRKLSTVPLDSPIDGGEFRTGKAKVFPEIPGEVYRNQALPQIREQYRRQQSTKRYSPPGAREPGSRAGSFGGSIDPGVGVASGSTTRRATRVQTLDITRSSPPQSPPIDVDEIRPIEPEGPS